MTKYKLVALDSDSKVITESVSELQCVGVALDHVSVVSNLVHALDVLTENGYRVIVEHGGHQWIHENVQGDVLVEGPWDAIKSGVGSAREVLNKGANKDVNFSNLKKGAKQFYQGAKDRYKEATRDPFDGLKAPDRAARDEDMASKGYRKEETEYEQPVTRYRGANTTGRSHVGGSRDTVGSRKATNTAYVKDNLPANTTQPIEGEVKDVSELKYKKPSQSSEQNFDDFEEVNDYTPPAIAQRKAAPVALPPGQSNALPPGTTGRAEKEARAAGQTLPSGDEAISMQGGKKASMTKGILTQFKNMSQSEQKQLMQAMYNVVKGVQ